MEGDRPRSSFYRRPRKPGDAETPPTPPPEQDDSPPAVPEQSHSHDHGERIVVPREARGSRTSGLELELREVRYGATSRSPYLRVVPGQRRFERSAPHVITATRQASKPVTGIERVLQSIKRILLGNPFASAQAIHERLSKVKALAIFSSDALSSSAYATEEILLILVLAGSAALTEALPISVVIALLLAVVTISYRQTVTYYPSGGGAYSVAAENLGRYAGLLAAAALSIGYILTVSVSVAAGVAAVTSAVPDLLPYRVPLGVVMIGVLTILNLRGIREAGTMFAIPTYYFIAVMVALIGYGVFQVTVGDAPGTIREPAPPLEEVPAVESLTLLLMLRAFAAGCAGLTGVEAISNGVPAFKPPESENAKTTLAWMAIILAFFLVGVTFLATRYGIVPVEDETAVSALGKQVFGENLAYYGLQIGTALVLFLAANTSYAGFPLMGAILAKDKFLPRQFGFRGDRLAYSNGIIALALAAAVLLAVFEGEVTKLIPLYALGVFISFTLSQSGMVKHLWKLRDESWLRAAAVSALGAAVTFVVAVIVGITRFEEGAWISMVMMGVAIGMFVMIRRHYDWYDGVVAISEEEAAKGVPGAAPREAAREHVVIPIDGINKVSMGAVGMGRAVSANVTAVHLTDDLEAAEALREQWERVAPDVPILIIDSPYRAFAAPMLAYMDLLERTEPDKRITVILPGFKAHHWWESLLHNQAVRRLRPLLEEDPGIRVVDFDYDVDRNGRSAT